MSIQIQANTQGAVINVANSSIDGSGSITTLLTSSATYGTTIQEVVITGAVTSINPGMIRFFVSPSLGPSAYQLIREVPVAPAERTGLIRTFSAVVVFDIMLANGWTLGVSTEVADTFAITCFGVDVIGFT